MNFLRDESGATAVEYVLLVGVIGATLAVAAGLFGEAVAAAFGSAGSAIGEAAST